MTHRAGECLALLYEIDRECSALFLMLGSHAAYGPESTTLTLVDAQMERTFIYSPMCVSDSISIL